MPENLDRDQWKAAIEWARRYPESHRGYPEPSSIYDEDEGKPDDEDGRTELSDDSVKSAVRNTLTGICHLFNVLVHYKRQVDEIRDARVQGDREAPPESVGWMKADITSISEGIRLLEAHVEHLKALLNVAGTSSLSSADTSVSGQFDAIFQGLLSIYQLIVECKPPGTS